MIVAMSLLTLASSALVVAPVSSSARNVANSEVILQNYPARALAAKEQGSVIFQVRIDREGHPTECVVTGSSGYPQLDNETCDLILTKAVFPAHNALATNSGTSVHEGAVNWRLPNGPSPTGEVKVAAGGDPLDKKICKRDVEPGTLAKIRRVCMTRREWQAQSQDSKAPWEDMQGSKGWKAGIEAVPHPGPGGS